MVRVDCEAADVGREGGLNGLFFCCFTFVLDEDRCSLERQRSNRSRSRHVHPVDAGHRDGISGGDTFATPTRLARLGVLEEDLLSDEPVVLLRPKISFARASFCFLLPIDLAGQRRSPVSEGRAERIHLTRLNDFVETHGRL